MQKIEQIFSGIIIADLSFNVKNRGYEKKYFKKEFWNNIGGSNLPAEISITSLNTTRLSISIDTGIR